MSEKRFHQFGLWVIDNPNFNRISIADLVDTELMSITEVVDLLNEQQATIEQLQKKLDKGNKALHKFITDNEELKTHNLQHFLEWLVIKGYVTDEPMKDINNVIDCVNKFKEYLPVLNKITEINNEIGFDSDE